MPNNDQAVDQIEELGYTREETIEALRATNWNVANAIDRLDGEDEMEDIDDELHDIVANQAEETLMDQIISDPLFKHIRDQIRNDPEKASEYMLQLRDLRPDLHELLVDEPDIIREIIEEIMLGSESPGGEDDDQWEDDENIPGSPGASKLC